MRQDRPLRPAGSGVTPAGSAPVAALEFVLPDLEESVDSGIQRENLHAVQALYFACMLEELRLFEVVERIGELFRQGLLPLGPGYARDFLADYDRWSADRMSSSDRRRLYAAAFGVAGGVSGGEPNRDFERLWMRFLSAISNLATQIDKTPASDDTTTLTALQEVVRRAGRDLARNLSLHGYGITYLAAAQLAQTIVEFRELLRDDELQAAFGARDMWQVIDSVSSSYLGGARDTNRYRTQAKAGAVIIRWIGNHASRLASPSGDTIDVDEVSRLKPPHAPPGHNPMVDPTDQELVDACEQWLADDCGDDATEGASHAR